MTQYNRRLPTDIEQQYFKRQSPGVERKEALVSHEILEGLRRIEQKLDKIFLEGKNVKTLQDR